MSLYFYIKSKKMNNILLYSKLASLPENMKSEVSDFIDLMAKAQKEKKNTTNTKPHFGSAKGMFKMNADLMNHWMILKSICNHAKSIRHTYFLYGTSMVKMTFLRKLKRRSNIKTLQIL